jgi:FAD/FMN-containing dehydrogenase
MEVEAGVTTAEVRRRAREVGLRFPPDPGAGEQSQIGGNIATNAGGPHAFKYGVTGAWVTGLEAVVPPGEVVRLGGPVRKDVAGYDLRSLLVGSEGTLGIITAAWLRLVPAAEAAYPIVASYADVGAGCGALDEVLGSGVHPAAIEYLDAGALRAASRRFPGGLVPGAAFALVVETDGAEAAARAERDLLLEILAPAALACHAPTSREDTAALWRWREGVSLAVAAVRGGKLSEDVAVPVERLREAIEETVAIGARHGVEACSWGHAGDGNLHATFLVGATDRAGLERSEVAARELFGLALRLGGTVSGEHGLGLVKGGQLRRAWEPRAVGLHEAVKRAFDPKGLLNPGKKLA